MCVAKGRPDLLTRERGIRNAQHRKPPVGEVLAGDLLTRPKTGILLLDTVGGLDHGVGYCIEITAQIMHDPILRRVAARERLSHP